MEYKRKVKGDILIGYIFILPTLILISFIVFYPLIDTFYLSLFKTSLVLPQPKFVGWKGYWEISTSGPLWLIIKNSLIWTILVVIFQFILGIVISISIFYCWSFNINIRYNCNRNIRICKI